MAGKDVEVKARVTSQIRKQLEEIAAGKGEALSLVVREAINEYLQRKEACTPEAPRQRVSYSRAGKTRKG